MVAILDHNAWMFGPVNQRLRRATVVLKIARRSTQQTLVLCKAAGNVGRCNLIANPDVQIETLCADVVQQVIGIVKDALGPVKGELAPEKRTP